MASSTSPSSKSVSISQTRMITGLLLGAFLFFSYRIISMEVEAFQSETIEPKPMTVPTQGIMPASSQHLPPASETGAIQKEEASKPRVKRAREGSRREWYERRKRRWFTPPTPKVDTGLPPKRSRFKMS